MSSADGVAFDDLLAVADASLASLDVDGLLDVLLERVRTILQADTAAVLLRDAGSEVLTARAARGLEAELRQGVRIPVGRGFAGTVAATRRPVALSRVDDTTVINPVLWEAGIQTMIGVPLLANDEMLGVLHVGRLAPLPFTEDEISLLEVTAERIAAAVETRRLEVEATVARELERSLQPNRLPRLEQLDFAARYVPCDRAIGGDWYDAFVLPGGRLWVVIGDVAGHGLPAAVVMGRVKSALRAFTLVADHPAEVLELTDRKVQLFEFGTIITVACATAVPPYDRFEVCSAGHLPPIVAAAGQPARLVELDLGPPLGVLRDLRRATTEFVLPPSALALLYTDGLIERRSEPIDERLEVLRSTVVADDPDALCRKVMSRLVDPGVEATDDIAVLAFRRSP